MLSEHQVLLEMRIVIVLLWELAISMAVIASLRSNVESKQHYFVQGHCGCILGSAPFTTIGFKEIQTIQSIVFL